MPDLIIADVVILQDSHGRYSLNTLHQASGGRASKKPSTWINLVGTQELIAELSYQRQNPVFDVVKGGNASGIYADELLAVSYAGWISPAFQLRVNQIFLASKRADSRVPQVRDQAIQMIIDMAVQLDAARTLAQEAKQEAALATANIERLQQTQLFFTIAEYVQVHALQAQLPQTAYRELSDHLRTYCMDRNIPFRKAAIGGKAWQTEFSFLVSVFTETLPGWLKRRFAQTHLRVLSPPLPTDNTDSNSS